MNAALALGSSSVGRARLLRSFVLSAPQQLDRRRDSPLPLVRASLSTVDPAWLATPSRLRQPVATHAAGALR